MRRPSGESATVAAPLPIASCSGAPSLARRMATRPPARATEDESAEKANSCRFGSTPTLRGTAVQRSSPVPARLTCSEPEKLPSSCPSGEYDRALIAPACAISGSSPAQACTPFAQPSGGGCGSPGPPAPPPEPPPAVPPVGGGAVDASGPSTGVVLAPGAPVPALPWGSRSVGGTVGRPRHTHPAGQQSPAPESRSNATEPTTAPCL